MGTLFEQQTRRLLLETPLGKDALLLEAFTGQEDISRPFVFELALLSQDHAIAAAELVGKPVGFEVSSEGGESRVFHGHVAAFAAGALATRDLRTYRARVVPWLWFLKKRAGCRIFQQKTALDIAEQLFDELGFSDYDVSGVRGELPQLEYCVQYRESDLDFLSRLFEEAGIFYFFRHEKERHVLVLADAKVAYADCAEKDVPFSAGAPVANHITRWEHRWQFVSGACAHADYNFETPLTKLRSGAKTVVELPGTDAYEVYDYPGRFPDGGTGDARVQQRMEEEEAGWDVVEGDSTCRTFTLGGKFRLTSHECAAEENHEYVLVALGHSARDTSIRGGSDGAFEYSNSFRCIPAEVVFRPPRTTQKPLIPGPQTAVVVGPSGEEIYTDEYGRVKVQFHWDREGKADEKSSCWIRVAQVWAGKNWGVTFHPRIGQEVVVEFLEGDPDRPLITGSVYNADQKPPYELPANQTQTVVKSRSSKGADPSNFNEIRFEDKKGEEDVFIHAEKDLDLRVKNDRNEWTGKDHNAIVKADHKELIEGSAHLEVKGDRMEKTGGADNLTVGGERFADVTGKDHLKVAQDRMVEVGMDDNLKAKMNLNLEAGMNASLKTGMGLSQKAGTTYAAEAGTAVHIKGGMDVVIEAGVSLTLKAGASFIAIGPAGVAINGAPMLMMNSGGAAGAGAGCQVKAPAAPEAAQLPEPPKEALAGQPGNASKEPKPAEPPPVTEYSPAATTLKQAAQDGTPFCEQCEAAKKSRA